MKKLVLAALLTGCASSPTYENKNEVAALYQRVLAEGKDSGEFRRLELSLPRRHVTISARSKPEALIITDVNTMGSSGLYIADGIDGPFDGEPDRVKCWYGGHDFKEEPPGQHTAQFHHIARRMIEELDKGNQYS